jgi:hypothetical protein
VLTRAWATDKSLPPTPMTAAISSSKSCQADPGAIDDETVSESCALRGIVLRAKILPAGEVPITMRLWAIEDGCRVEMDEVAISGPPKLLPRVVQQGLFAPRNRECLWRLANIAEHKQPGED